jgi:hypothetical protein
MGWYGITALGAAIIGGGIAATGKNPYSAKDVKGALGMNAPRPGEPPVMPDQATLLQEQTLQESKDAAMRYGRAATVLTNPGGPGGASGGDKLGP